MKKFITIFTIACMATASTFAGYHCLTGCASNGSELHKTETDNELNGNVDPVNASFVINTDAYLNKLLVGTMAVAVGTLMINNVTVFQSFSVHIGTDPYQDHDCKKYTGYINKVQASIDIMTDQGIYGFSSVNISW
jgi:hypothetical protein